MAGSHIKGTFKPKVRKFGYIDRRGLSTKVPFDTLDIGTNIKIDPEGRIDIRDGYTQLFTTRPGWFEDTTLYANRFIDDNIVTDIGTAAYTSPRRKCLVEMSHSGTRYLFAGVVVVKNPMALLLYRGKIGTNNVVAWETTPFTVFVNPIGAGFQYLGNDAADSNQQWIEFSMSKKSDDSELYVAAILRDDASASGGNNYAQLKVAKLTDLFDVAWNPTQTAMQLNSAGDETITEDSDNAFTHDLDIVNTPKTVGADNYDGSPVIVYGFWDDVDLKFELRLIRAGSKAFASPVEILTATHDVFGAALVWNEYDDTVGMVYIKSLIGGGADLIRYSSFSSMTLSVLTTTDITATFAKYLTDGGLFTTVPAICIDVNGGIHVLYRKDATGGVFYCVSADFGGTWATPTDLSAVFDIEEGDGTTLHSGLPSYLHNWDMIVKGGGSTASVHIYYVKNGTTGYQLWRADKYDSVTFPNATLELVHQSKNTNPRLGFICCDRTNPSRATRELCLLDFSNIVADFLHLTEMLDAVQGDLTPEMIHDTMLTEAAGTSAQTKIVHCSNNRLYKRNAASLYWELLENSMDAENAEESWWKPLDDALASGGFALTVAPDPVTHVTFKDRKGVVNVGYGVGEKLVGANYRLINRSFFNDTAANGYADHFLDVSPLKPPDSSILVPDVVAISATIANAGRAVSNIVHRRIIPQGGGQANEGRIVWNGVAGVVGDDIANYSFVAHGTGAGYVYGVNEAFFSADRGMRFNDTQTNEDNGRQVVTRCRSFYVALSYVYDGFQESQLYVIPNANTFGSSEVLGYGENGSDGLVGLGYRFGPEDYGFYILKAITVNLRLPDLMNRVVGGLNPRITAVKVYLGEVTDAAQKSTEVNFYPAKTILISKVGTWKDTAADWANGEKPWVLNGSYWEHNDTTPGNYYPVVIDVDDYLAMFDAGTYESINGHTDTFMDATLGLQRSPFPESYKVMETFGTKTVLGGVRIDGVNRDNRLLINGVKVTSDGQSVDTPDVLPDQLAIDLDFKIQNIAKIDDTTGVVIGDTGIGILDVVGRVFRKLDKHYGTDSPDSVSDLSVGKEGVGFLFKDKFVLFQGYVDPESISDQIKRDSEFGSSIGLTTAIAATTDCWAFYVADAKQLLLIFRASPYPVFILDMNDKNGGWLHATFTDAFKAGCNGVDEKLYWLSGYKVFQYPYGQTDNGTKPSIDFRLSDASLPEDIELDVERFYLTAKQGSGETLSATIIRDRDSSKNIVHTITGTGSTHNNRREINRVSALNALVSRKCRREVSIRIQATTPTTLNIEEISIDGVLMGRIT